MKNLKYIFILYCSILMPLIASNRLQADVKYLTGNFNPANDKTFISLSKLGIPVKNGQQYLRREAAEALFRMINDFRSENPKVPFYVTSSTRTFISQKAIWNGKWRGIRKSNGLDLSREKNLRKRGRMILEYSSMPGTSRHHWGTDFDINILTNDYYEHGEGRILFEWLNTHAAGYGFARPYTAGRVKGYREEKWHWSYLPLARKCYNGWMEKFGNDLSFFTGKGLFDGSEIVGSFALEYVESINPECK